jgi:iron complex transport system substrate-binding protein
MRIVSLLPSATEIICELGLGDDLVGVTHECDAPPFVRGLPKVTRTLIPVDASSHEIDSLVRERLKTERALYTLDMPTLERLRPDLIVTQALCDVCAVAASEVTAAACSLPGLPRVVNLEPVQLSEVFDCLRLVGAAAGVPDRADRAIARLTGRVEAVRKRTESVIVPPRTLLLEWIDPPFSSGHWSPELVRLAGGREGVGQEGQPSRTLRWEEVLEFDPEVLVIACCGFTTARTMVDIPILRRYPDFAQLACVRQQRVFVVDGNAYFSRPGPRLVDSLELLAHTLHPNLHPLPAHLSPARRLSPLELGTSHDPRNDA